ncbi:MAG: hypothetical protein JSR77_15565 [Planctomycetes bacterium]|nr:hypothetical protein [Planctomycetota bacterium]
MLQRSFAMLAICSTSISFAQVEKPFAKHEVHRITVQTPRQLSVVTELADNIWSCSWGVGPIDAQFSPEKLPAFLAWADQQGLEHARLIPDVQSLIDAEREQIDRARRERNVDWFATYHTLAEINARLDELAANFPAFASTFSVGQSIEGRTIRGIRFSAPDQPGNPRSARPQVMVEGAQHAREWISPCVNMWVADRMLETYATDPAIRTVLDSVEVIVVPVINVDGYEYTWIPANRLWRKNRRNNGNGTFGVDLNRNWGYQWGGEGASTATNNDTYRGVSGFSEPETQVMRDFIAAQPRLKAHIDFHSYSQLILSPYAYTAALCPDNPLFERINTIMKDSIYAVHQMNYTAGPTYTTIYPASGAVTDWVYGARDVLAWGFELRDTGQTGFVLPAAQIVPTCEENFQAFLKLCEFSARPLWFSLTDGSLPNRLITGTPASFRVSIKNGSDALDPAGVALETRTSPLDPFTSTPATVQTPGIYAAAFPAFPCGATAQYRISAGTTSGRTVYYPEDGSLFSVPSADSYVTFADDMESDRGWTVGAAGDTATGGLWQRADPEPTNAQPADDASPAGTLCWITGAAAGANANANDVDGGATTLTSPRFSALPPPATRVLDIRIAYARWYSNNTGSNTNSDSMPVQISNDDGATWTQLELVTENAAKWVRKSISLPAGVAPTARMRLRFIARDTGLASTVEAGVDDVAVDVYGCLRNADVNGDGGIDGADVETFFLAWQDAQPIGDFNEDGGIDGADVEEFFLAWEHG